MSTPIRKVSVLGLALLALGAGCGDNVLGATPYAPGPVLAPAADLAVIAHQDDDLLFMQPDVIEAVRRGHGVTNVYVTAGNASKGTLAADIRYEGLKQAYGAAAGSFDWTCGYIAIDDHIAQHCRLEAQRVSLVFLAYPDGLVRGEKPTSLLHLWQGDVDTVETIAPLTATYDRDGLLDTLAEIVRQTQPRVVHTLEIAGTHGSDEHADHMVVGAATLPRARPRGATPHAVVVSRVQHVARAGEQDPADLRFGSRDPRPLRSVRGRLRAVRRIVHDDRSGSRHLARAPLRDRIPPCGTWRVAQ